MPDANWTAMGKPRPWPELDSFDLAEQRRLEGRPGLTVFDEVAPAPTDEQWDRLSSGSIDFFGTPVPYEDLGDGRLRFQVADIPPPPDPPGYMLMADDRDAQRSELIRRHALKDGALGYGTLMLGPDGPYVEPGPVLDPDEDA